MNFTAHLRGVSFRTMEVKEIVNTLCEGDYLFLVRESTNQHDPNAVKVMLDGVHLGYVAKEVAQYLGPLIDSGRKFICVVDDMSNWKMPMLYIEEILDAA